MFTLTFGVQENFSTEHFYRLQTNFNHEQERINKKFTQLNELGLKVFKKSLTLDEIKAQLGPKCACIVLIDANKLNGIDTDSLETVQNMQINCFSNLIAMFKSKLGYAGHFIVLIGFDNVRQLIFYRNPSTSKRLSYTGEENFELARKSYGADEDIIFLYL